MKELELELRLRNNLLKQRRVELGLSAPQLAKKIGICYAAYIALENMHQSPLRRDGKRWRAVAIAIADFFAATPELLWPSVILAVKQPVVTKQLALEEIDAIAKLAADPVSYELDELALEIPKMKATLRRSMTALTNQERAVLKKRFGLGESREHTLAEIGNCLGLSGERTRQIQESALEKLHRPMNTFRYTEAT